MKVKGIDYISVAVTDMHRALAFYRDFLGLPLQQLILEDSWAEFATEPVTLVVQTTDGFFPKGSEGGSLLALAVDDVQAALEEAEQAGVPVEWQFEETPVCYLGIIRDPDGNRIIIHQRKDGTWG